MSHKKKKEKKKRKKMPRVSSRTFRIIIRLYYLIELIAIWRVRQIGHDSLDRVADPRALRYLPPPPLFTLFLSLSLSLSLVSFASANRAHNSHVHEASFSPPLSSTTRASRAAIFPRPLSPAARRASVHFFHEVRSSRGYLPISPPRRVCTSCARRGTAGSRT